MLLVHRRGADVRVEQDRHRVGVFPRSTWIDTVQTVGFQVAPVPFVQSEYGAMLELLIGRKNKAHA